MGSVLGIDPSLRGTGLALVERDAEGNFSLKTFEVIGLRSAKRDEADCLGAIFQKMGAVIEEHRPEAVALEQPIHVQNVRTAQSLGAVRGVVLMAARLKNLPVDEYPPLRVKQSISGYGRARKEQVARMVKALLHLAEDLPHDAADAAAVALCHFFSGEKNLSWSA
ncbi:MAG: crossover junction endodeoxyribonuclease RuvC [Puniceicoccales bacterium]|jgi:crossover junction endodeoxyribonuclease RuvC|nr:crossover junction endodeoxyribonuclease RuvC [Puniceicoccales bacterium]